MTDGNTLPQSLLSWIAATAGGELVSVGRHTARREAWNVEVRTPDGANERYFLRIDRGMAEGKVSTRNLRRESKLIEALESLGILAQKIVGWNDEHCAALQSFTPGLANLHHEDPATQDSVMRDFMEIMAAMHRIDVSKLDLPEFDYPRTPLEHSIMEIEAVEEPGLFPISICKTDVLAAFGKRWLINHAPASVERTALVQGDTGAGNFLYDPKSGKVTAVVDWEWGHYGDPLEDLGNVWLRDLFYPSAGGDITPYFQLYAERAGLTLDRTKIEYYKIHQLVRSVQALAKMAEVLDWQTPIPLNLGYRAYIDIQTCQAMREASGDSAPRALPVFEGREDSLSAVLAKQIEAFVMPHLEEPFAKFMSGQHANLARYLDLREQNGPEVEAQERAGLSDLLGRQVTDIVQGRRDLIALIETLGVNDEAPVLAHLSRVAELNAALMAPLIAPYVGLRWAKLDC